MTKTIPVVGTFDTKADELGYLIGRIKAHGGSVIAMDVSVLGEARIPVEVSKHHVAAAAGVTIEQLVAPGEEGAAFARMSEGAALLTRQFHAAGRFDGMTSLGSSCLKYMKDLHPELTTRGYDIAVFIRPEWAEWRSSNWRQKAHLPA